MKTYALVAGDLFACMAVVFLVSLGILVPLTQEEVLTSLQATKTDKESDPTAPVLQETMLLEVIWSKSGAGYRLVFPGGREQRFKRYDRMIEALRKERPQHLRLRVDRRVSSGIYQDLILDSRKLHIRIWQENQHASIYRSPGYRPLDPPVRRAVA